MTHNPPAVDGPGCGLPRCEKVRRRGGKAIKPNTTTKLLSFSYGIMWDCVISIQKRAPEGHWIFMEGSNMDIQEWVRLNWSLTLGYTLKVKDLMNSWFSFQFLHLDDVEKIFKRPWVNGRRYLQLHKWYVGFNPLLDTPINEIVWVKLPGLPLE